MFEKKRIFALILCVILLLPILGCGQNKPRESKPLPSQTVQESAPAPESSKPSGPVYDTEPPVMESEEEITDSAEREPAYTVKPLEEPKNGAMTYEEFFFEERFVQNADQVCIENAPSDIVETSHTAYEGKVYLHDVKDGYLNLVSRSEIWWYSYDFSERVLIYRAEPKDEIIGLTVYDNVAIFTLAVNSSLSERWTYRIYLPTLEVEHVCSFGARMLEAYSDSEFLGHSTTLFRINSFTDHPIGALVYCETEDTVYFTKGYGQIGDEGVWEEVQRQKAFGIFEGKDNFYD